MNDNSDVSKSVNPIGFINKSGIYEDWTEDPLTEPFRKMVKTSPQPGFYIPEKYPTRFQFNFKLTKEIGEHLKIAFLTNNFLNIRPKYQYNRYYGFKLLNQDLYFGAEMIFEL